MRHSIVVKFLMILLTACSLVAAVAGAAGIVAMEGSGLYVNGLEELRERECSSIATSRQTKLFSNASWAALTGFFSLGSLTLG